MTFSRTITFAAMLAVTFNISICVPGDPTEDQDHGVFLLQTELSFAANDASLHAASTSWDQEDAHIDIARVRTFHNYALDMHEGPFWSSDLFPNATSPVDGDEGLHVWRAAPAREWLILGSVCLALFLLDAVLIQRFTTTPCFASSVGVLVFWVLVAVGFDLQYALRNGTAKALEWLTGYLLEWMLSIDNLFVFHLVLQTYQTPLEQMHKAVFAGIVGAVLIRLVLFMMVSEMLLFFFWARVLLGMLLIWSGVQAAWNDDDDDVVDVQGKPVVRCFRSCLGSRLLDSYDEQGRFITFDENGRLRVTLLFIVVVCLEVVDVVFAVDSVCAKVAQIPNQYIAFSSSVLAMFGLRATFFIVRDLVSMFSLLKYGLCFILVFIGFELLFSHALYLAPSAMCGLVVFVFTVSILGSGLISK